MLQITVYIQEIRPNAQQEIRDLLLGEPFPQIPLARFLLDADHPRVQASVEALKKNSDIRKEKAWDVAKKKDNWPDMHATHFASMGLRPGASKPSEHVLASESYRHTCSRGKDIVLVSEKLGAGCCDTSQTLGRHRMSKPGLVPTLTPKEQLWIFHVPDPDRPGEMKQIQRYLLGREALALQGFPVEQKPMVEEEQDESFLNELAGNAFALPCPVAVFGMVMACIDFRDAQEVAGEAGAALVSNDGHYYYYYLFVCSLLLFLLLLF